MNYDEAQKPNNVFGGAYWLLALEVEIENNIHKFAFISLLDNYLSLQKY